MKKVGDILYYATCHYGEKSIPCPICYTKKFVVVILGNGDEVKIPCNYCVRGIDPPSGYVTEYDYIVKATMFTITGIDVNITEDGEKRTYRSGHYVLDENLCFETEAEALEAAVDIKADLDAKQKQRSDWIKHNKTKSFAWNAGYHLREAKHAQEQLEYHSQMAVLCKEKKKEGI